MRFAIPALFGLLLIAADLGLGGLLGFGTIRPSLVLPFIVLQSLRNGPIQGTIVGFCVGILVDLMGGSAMGSTSLALALCGFLPGRFWSGGPLRVHWPWGVFLLLSALMFESTRHLILSRETGYSFGALFVSSAAPSALYTTLLGIIWFLSPLNRKQSL